MGKTAVCSVSNAVRAFLNFAGIPIISALFAMLSAPLNALAINNTAFPSGLFGSGPAITEQQDGQPPMLEPSKPVERQLSGTQIDTYRLTIPEHQYAKVVVEQRGVDVTAQLLDSAGTLLANYNSESRLQGNETLDIVADAPVTYQIKIKANYPKIAAGRYQIQIVEIRKATDKDLDEFEAHKLATRAFMLSTSGKSDESFKLSQQALERAEKAFGPEDAYVGELAMRLGQTERIRGDYDNAEAALRRSIAIFEKISPKQDTREALALGYLGQVYWGRNELIKAEQYQQEAIEIFRNVLGPEHPLLAGATMQNSTYRVGRGDFAAALSMLQAARAIADKTLGPDDITSMGIAHNLGNLYLEQGDYERAEEPTEWVLNAVEKKFGPDSYILIAPLQNLGTIARNKKQYPRALELLGRAEAISEKEIGPQKPDTASLLINIGNVYKDEKELTKAVEYFQRALNILEVAAGPYHSLTRAALANLADTYSQMGDKPHALEYQTRVAQVIDKEIEFNLMTGSERQRLAYRDFMAGRTDLTVSFHLQTDPQNRAAAELAVLTVLRRKALVLDSVSGNLAAIRQRMNPDDQKLIDQLGNTDAQLAKVALTGPGKTAPAEYRQKLQQLEGEKEKLEADISERSAAYFEKTDSVTLKAIEAAIPSDAALVEFVVYRPHDLTGGAEFREPRYCAYIVRHEGDIKWADLGSAKEIDKAVDALRQALQDPNRKDVRQLARAADEKIFQPIRPLVGNAIHLLIAPDGELDLVPFQALLNAQGHFLVEQFAVTYLTTGRDLLRMTTPQKSKGPALLVANPLFDEPTSTMSAKAQRPQGVSPNARRSITSGQKLSDVYFAPLIGTEREARAIETLFPDAHMLTGAQATKAALERADAPQILHIATHGFFLEDQGSKSSTEPSDASGEPENPLLRSGLAFAGANSKRVGVSGGILTALEASNLNLWGTKLVTLSACDTGIGDVKNGEGVYGLRRAFVLAGAETLVMSLWPVSDEITREMMTSYYTGLKKGLGRGEALRQTQLAMLKRKDRVHPFYWASFIQSGEWANLDGKR